MDNRQKAIARMAKDIAGDWIGGLENTLLDFEEDSEEYKNAKHDLELGHEYWKKAIVSEVKDAREAQKQLKFVGNKFLEDYVDRLLTKWGY